RASSTLFPYTTLFRSEAVLDVTRLRAQHPETRAELGGRRGDVQVGADAVRVRDRDERVVVRLRARAADVRLGVDLCRRAEEDQRDRKSTRLNSSHEWI